MKNVLIGGLVALIGSIWALAVSVAAVSNLVSGWSTPPGRFLTTVLEMGLLPVLLPALAAVLFGLCLLLVEYFRKEK